MGDYVILLRGINLGKDNKVSMPVLKSQLQGIGVEKVSTYINTGNVLVNTSLAYDELIVRVANLLNAQYEFAIPFVVLNQADVVEDMAKLPNWWHDETSYRRDALFYLPPESKQTISEMIAGWDLTDNEAYYLGETALFWRVKSQPHGTKSIHAKKVMSKPFNQLVTLRNANTTNKLVALFDHVKA